MEERPGAEELTILPYAAPLHPGEVRVERTGQEWVIRIGPPTALELVRASKVTLALTACLSVYLLVVIAIGVRSTFNFAGWALLAGSVIATTSAALELAREYRAARAGTRVLVRDGALWIPYPLRDSPLERLPLLDVTRVSVRARRFLGRPIVCWISIELRSGVAVSAFKGTSGPVLLQVAEAIRSALGV